MMPRRSLTKEQARELDEAFKAQLQVDLMDVEHLLSLIPRSQRPDGVALSPEQLAKPVKEILGLSLRGTSNRMHGNGIPRSYKERSAFMGAVEEALKRQFELVGGTFEGSYETFVNPVAQEDEDEADDAPRHLGRFEEWMHVRPGAWLADQRKAEHVDNTHHYELIFRQDMLDYDTGDFYSLRRLRGRNVSQRPTSWVPYRESSENQFTFADADVTAFDYETRAPLDVDPELKHQKSHTHAFRIHFARPIEPGEPFDVVYNIRLPGELNELRHESEVMSISLVRVAKRLGELIFNVVANFKPTAAAAYYLTKTGKFVACRETPRVEPYVPEDWFEAPDVFGIEWSCERPYIIRWQTSQPTGRMYVINFRGAGLDNPLTRGAR